MNKIKTIIVIALALTLISVANAYTIGQRGSDVADLQIMLIEAGFDIPAISSGGATPGYFGTQTQKAYTAYTASKGSGLRLGAISGPTFYSPAIFYNGATYSSVFATSSTGAGTLTAANLLDRTSILSTNAGALTLTMPASTTLTSFVPVAGDVVEMVLVNQGTTLLTLAGGTGTLLQTASSTKTVNIGGSATLRFIRKANTDVIVNMSPAI